MKILKDTEINIGAELVKNGEVIAFPTETVFGLGVIYNDKAAYDKLIAVKRRPPEKPFTLMISDVEDVEKYSKLNEVAKRLVKAFMPGQFTIILDAQETLPSWCVSKEGKVGIRIADYDLIRNIIRAVGAPMLVPSANKSGEPPANSVNEVIEAFNTEIPVVFEGKTVSKLPSTIVEVCGEELHIIRAGTITADEIYKIAKGE